MEELSVLCLRFRKAIEKCPKNLLPISFDLFPLGACGDASLVLAKFLQDNGYDGFDYVCGWKDTQSHAWLEKDGLIVNITLNQFDDQMPDVVVTSNSKFHHQFTNNQRSRADLSCYDPYTEGELGYAYVRILQYIDK